MNFKKFLAGFALTFVITFAVVVAVSFVWSLIFHGRGVPEWETAFRLAIILGIVVPLTKPRPSAEKAA